MSRSVRFLLLFGLFFNCIGFGQPNNFKSQLSPDSLVPSELYKGFLKNYHQSSNAVGSIMLIQKGESIWQDAMGYSNLKKKIVFSEHTPFYIGSISKTFLAIIVLQLIEEQRFGLDDKLVYFFPELSDWIEGFDKVTIRHLLSHTSGLIDPPNDKFSYQLKIALNPKLFSKMKTSSLVRKYLKKSKLKFPPGSNYSYSNSGYWILEMLVEKIVKQDISQVLNERIVFPLQLKQTGLGAQKDVSHGYHQKRLIPSKWISSWDEAEAGGKMAGGMISTASDLRVVFKNLFENKLINSNSLREMKRIQLTSCNNTECEYGLGLELWRFESSIGYGHNGTLIGAEANVLFFEETNTLIVLFKNCGGGSDKRFISDVIK